MNYSHLFGGLPEQAASFFAVFARAEYALKRNKYLVPSSDRRVKTDWDRFATKLGADFVKAIYDSKRAEMLLAHPPKKQVLNKDGELDWKDTGPVGNNPIKLFAVARRARNNLFHGGKFRGDEDTDTSRDETLLSEAEWVIVQAIEARSNVNIGATFRGG